MNRSDGKNYVNALIASPLEPEHVQRIRAFAPDRVAVLFEPDLLPVPRYVADHHGAPRNLDGAARLRWEEILRQADVAFDFDWSDPARLPERAPRLRWVQATSAGIGEFLAKTGLLRSGIQFTTASGVHAKPLAEFVVLGLLYLVRDVPALLHMKSERRWQRFTSRSLEGTRILLVGLGSVGRAVAKACASFDIEVWGMARTEANHQSAGVARCVARTDLRQALSEVDGLVLACPLTDCTRGLIGPDEIAAMRPGAFIVNVARGPIIDEQAMVAALASSRLSGAVLDVVAVEPLPPDSPLWALDNVIISPHSASTVTAENGRIVDIFLENLRRFLDGKPLVNLFDAGRGY